MITKTIRYFDFDENEIKKDFAFHLSKAEITELNFLEDGSTLDEVIIKMSNDSTNVRQIMDILKDILRKAVGRKSDNGTRFIKDEEAISELFDTDAYSELLIEIMTDTKKAAEFVTGILPKDLRSEYKKTLNSDDLDSLTPEQMREKLKAVREKAISNEDKS